MAPQKIQIGTYGASCDYLCISGNAIRWRIQPGDLGRAKSQKMLFLSRAAGNIKPQTSIYI